MCFVMFKFSTQQLLRKRNHILSLQCQPHSLWFVLSVCSRTSGSEERHCGLSAVPKGWGWRRGRELSWGEDAQPPWPWGCSVLPGLCLWLGSSGGCWKPSAFSVLVSCRKHCQEQGMCLMSWTLSRGVGNNIREQIKAEDVGKGSIVLLEDTCGKAFYFSPSVDAKRPFMKRHFCLIYSSL